MARDKGKLRIAVLCGGDSPEREVSLRSGAGIHRALRERGWRADLVAAAGYDGLPQRLAPYPVIFNIIHGGAGEDGTLQLLFDLLGKAYVGSGPLASALAMDKLETKKTLASKGIPVPKGFALDPENREELLSKLPEELSPPVVVKPRGQGSSVGLRLVREMGELPEAVDEVMKGFERVLVEEFIPGRELTVGVLEKEDGLLVLPPLELRPQGELFDWEAKYTPGRCEFLCPAPLSPDREARVREVAAEAFRALGCRDLVRVDIRLAPDGTPYVLELNTLPGMTEMSTFPRMAAAAGMSYGELVEGLLLRALARLPAAARKG
ncbi:D-alanine--D-alanine ligase [Candidatus Bipolaricaulota bacterium]|nr:D-alanine--D-alanine ligase [Candidatus Bipolaricaulota bacterium]